MGYIELSHFTALYPERVLKLIFLDAAYDNTSSENKAVFEKNPLPKMIPAWPDPDPETIEDYIATVKKLYPAMAVIWNQVMEEQTSHSLKTTPDGKVVDKMSNVISKAINDTFITYVPEYSNIRVPVLSFFAIRDGSDYLSPDYMTEDQKVQVTDFFKSVLQPHQKNTIEQFRRNVPHARVVEIPGGHHYCFIKQEEVVFDEMRKFLQEA
jgi:pimeloyl-ACP methyl ester carboxylesterase